MSITEAVKDKFLSSAFAFLAGRLLTLVDGAAITIGEGDKETKLQVKLQRRIRVNDDECITVGH